MPETFHSGVHALAQAILDEHQRAEDNPQHETIHISCVTNYLRNGLEHCSVQIECQAGCGWLVEAQGEQTDGLKQKAAAIQGLLHSSTEHPKSLSEILSIAFPEFIIESRLAMPNGKK